MSRLRYGSFLIPLALTLALLACSPATRSATPTSPPPTPAAQVEEPRQVPVTTAVVEPDPSPLDPTQPDLSPPVAVGTGEAPAVDTGSAPRSQPESEASPAPADGTLDPHVVIAVLENALTGIYESVLPSVAHIHVLSNPQSGGPFGESGRSTPSNGSGLVWSSDGHIVTNHHVIEDANQITVSFVNGLELKATVLGSDPDSDLAVLKVDPPPDGLRAVSLGDSDQLRVGQLTIAIGSPFSQEFSMTSGIVSALGRVLQAGYSNFSNPEIIQTDTAINPGNSGGPLFDRHGNVIGINSQIISRSGSNSGVGFAVPVNTAKRIVPVLIQEGSYSYAYLGISGATLRTSLIEANSLPSNTRGVLVVSVVPDSPADQAGISGTEGATTVDGIDYPVDGYVITAIDGTPVNGMDDLVAYMAENNRPGDTATLDVITDGRASRVQVVMGARPEVVS